MLSEFPNFKPIDLGSRAEIEALTQKFPPYCDYDFTTLWSWDIHEQRGVATLNNNLVIRFTDYLTGEFFYSVMGNEKVKETIQVLFADIEKHKEVSSDLKLIPKECLNEVDFTGTGIVVLPDRNNDDYVYSIPKIVDYMGAEYGTARNLLSRFTRRNKEISTRKLDLLSDADRELVLKINEEWQKNKGIYVKMEERALEKLLKNAQHFTLESIGVFVGEKIVGYAISEVLYNDFAITHFAQADITYAGVYAFLMQQIATSLQAKGCALLNYEQDLGLPGLRQGKLSYRPAFFLKKCSIVRQEW